MTPFLRDADFTLLNCDVLDGLRSLPNESVNCVVTSPPYWGLRDYGTGSWEGGDEGCDHETVPARSGRGGSGSPGKQTEGAFPSSFAASECGKCGARRVDQQLGLESTPEEYITRMTSVFREVRRVLRGDGTCWLNIGDSYADSHGTSTVTPDVWATDRRTMRSGTNRRPPGLKPKDLVGIPWRLAFALQADGWYLRADIIWSKPNPMPESVTDRPTKAHEYVFLLTKSARYWFDQEAVRERYAPATIERDQYGYGHAFANQFKGSPTDKRHPDGKQLPPGAFAKGPDGRRKTTVQGADGSIQHRDGERWPNGGRNIRSVWEIATQPYPEAHFATYPEELVRRCILAGCPEWVCGVCGKPRERIISVEYENPGNRTTNGPRSIEHKHTISAGYQQRLERRSETTGWSDCGHNNYRPGTVLDPFLGSGTTAVVARKHNRRCIGIELNESYCELAARRTQQLTLEATG